MNLQCSYNKSRNVYNVNNFHGIYLLTLSLSQLFPVVGWVQQAVPHKIEVVSRELEETAGLLTAKLDQEVETEIEGLNTLLQKQEEVSS